MSAPGEPAGRTGALGQSGGPASCLQVGVTGAQRLVTLSHSVVFLELLLCAGRCPRC